MRTVTTIFLFGALSCMLSAENLEKTQKKALEAQAKATMAEAKSLESSGQLADARAKYAESQALIETNDAANAIKHLDDEMHKQAKDVLSRARKLYESHKYRDAAATLEGGLKLGVSQPVIAYDLALCYYQLGDRDKAREYLQKSRMGTPDPKQKEKLSQLLTFFVTGEDGTTRSDSDKDRISRFNRLTDNVGLEASLEDEAGEDNLSFSEGEGSPVLAASLTSVETRTNSHTNVARRASLCTSVEELKSLATNSPSAIFNRANCAETNGRPNEAARLMQQYLDASPKALDASAVRSRLADLQALIALPDQTGVEVRRLHSAATGYLAERKYDRALAALSKASDLAPDFPLTHWKQALLYEALGNVDSAREQFIRYQAVVGEQRAKDEASLHLSTLDAKKSKYDEEVDEAEDILSDLFNRGMNLAFNLDDNRSAIKAKRARIKKKQDRKKDKYRVGGFAVPYPYAQQELARASEHLQVALAIFPLGAEANELMGLVFLQANDGHSATRSFDAVASQGLPVSFYAEMRGHKLDHGVKCELTRDHVRFIFLSSYDKKGNPIAPDKNAGDDGLGDITLAAGDQRQDFDSLEVSLSDIKRVETNRGLLRLKLAKQDFTLAPIFLPSFTPVEGPQGRRFANNYTRLFIRYPGLEDSKLGAEGLTGGEKFALGYKLATSSMDIAMNGFTGVGAIQSVQDTISIARTLHSVMASLSVSFASWERSVDEQQELLLGPTFKPIPTEPVNMAFVQEIK